MNKSIIHLSCGDFFTYCIDKDNIVYSWGSGMFGELGTGKYDNHSLP